MGAKGKGKSTLTPDDFLPEELRTKPKPTFSDLFSYLKDRAVPKVENN
jgi:hypothetical protein